MRQQGAAELTHYTGAFGAHCRAARPAVAWRRPEAGLSTPEPCAQVAGLGQRVHNLLPGAANGEVYIRDTYIGCDNCERNWQWLLGGVGDEPGVETKVYDKSMVKKAVKCDTSKGLPHGPACVSACPTGAALRVSPERLLDYINPVEA